MIDSRYSGLTRRQILRRLAGGAGLLGLAGVMQQKGGRAYGANPSLNLQGNLPARAKRVIFLFLNGGPSHVDTFDPKPALLKFEGQKPEGKLYREGKKGGFMPSPFKFTRHGASGIEFSESVSHLAGLADDLCLVRSMHTDVPNHEPSLLLMNCGESIVTRPSVGSWLTYGLGTENQNLPGFIAMCPGGYPIKESQNWNSAFLPGVYQGTYIDSKNTKDLSKLIPNIRNKQFDHSTQRRQLDLLQTINRIHRNGKADDSRLDARIHSFELAYRMQMDATDAFNINKEPQYIRQLYGDTLYGREFLIARRLLERGVRFIQLWHGKDQPWDNHDDLEQNHRKLARDIDQPIAALLRDLKQRGMLEDTLVIWGGEFGRTPVVELPTPGSNQGRVNGRDHNHHGFSMWMAGGGIKGGQVYGSTDEFGFRAVENPVHVHDLHATILHLMGFDHEQLTFRHAGRDFRLTDVHGEVVHGIIA